jgi:hypothetical protein
MQILPPDLEPFNRDRYYSDLAYREECDLEIASERYERLKLLFTD